MQETNEKAYDQWAHEDMVSALQCPLGFVVDVQWRLLGIFLERLI